MFLLWLFNICNSRSFMQPPRLGRTEGAGMQKRRQGRAKLIGMTEVTRMTYLKSMADTTSMTFLKNMTDLTSITDLKSMADLTSITDLIKNRYGCIHTCIHRFIPMNPWIQTLN